MFILVLANAAPKHRNTKGKCTQNGIHLQYRVMYRTNKLFAGNEYRYTGSICSGNLFLFLIAPFPDICLLVPFYKQFM